MSLVFLKSKNNETSAEGNPHTPSRFSNYFTQPLHIEPNSQIALVNTQFHAKEGAELENGSQVLYTRIGNEYMNPILQYPLNDLYISNWEAYTNQIARAMNMVNIDGNFSHQLERNSTPIPITVGTKTSDFNQQAVFESGFNAWYSQDKKVFLRCTQRGISDQTFNQGFNCLGANATINYNQAGGAGIVGAGINLGAGDNLISFVDCNVYRTNSSKSDPSTFPNPPTIFGSPSNALTPQMAGGGGIRVESSFYNTQWACNRLSGSALDYGRPLIDIPSPFGNTNAADNSEIAFNNDNGSYAMLMFDGGIKQYVTQQTPNAVPELNGGGHVFPSSNVSGGYALITRDMLSKTSADVYTDVASVGALNQGRVGLTASCFGVHSQDFINTSFDVDPAVSRRLFLENCDLSISDSATVPQHAAARYIFGVRYKWEGAAPNLTLVAQAEMLDFASPATHSEYIPVGNPLDLYQLCAGSNTATTPASAFGGGTLYDINITGGANTQTRLIWRFRWISPYQMTIEFCFEIDGNPAGAYNVVDDTPHAPAAANTDPTAAWCTLYTMDVGTDGTTAPSYYFPSWHGGLCVVDYPTRNNQYSYSKGFYDVRAEYRLKQGLAAISGAGNSVDGNSIPALQGTTFFSGGDPYPSGDYDIINYTMCKNAGGAETSLIENLTPEKFSTGGLSEKMIFWLVNSISDLAESQEWAAFGDGLNVAPPMFDVGNPPLLDWGVELGLINSGEPSILTFDEDVDGLGTPYEIYGHNPISKIQVGNAGLTLHYQIQNLPVASQNGVVASTNKTIYVVNTKNEDRQTDNDLITNRGDWYAYEPHEKLWIDLNNYSPMDLNRLDVLITNDNNVEAKDNLRYFTDLVVCIRQKPNNQGFKQFASTVDPAPVNVDPSEPYFQNMR